MSSTNEPMAYMTRDEEGSPEMLFFDREEATRYCLVGEEPEALHPASLVEQQRRRIAELEQQLARMTAVRDAMFIDNRRLNVRIAAAKSVCEMAIDGIHEARRVNAVGLDADDMLAQVIAWLNAVKGVA